MYFFFTVSHFQAQAEELLTRLYGLTASSVKEFNSYDDRNFYFRVRETGAGIWPHGYILKVMTILPWTHSGGSLKIGLGLKKSSKYILC